jgi:hypothetical protein
MLEQILKTIPASQVLTALKANPTVILPILQSSETFILFGKALTGEQQKTISSNLHLVDSFLKTDDGKTAISMFAESFSDFVTKPPR